MDIGKYVLALALTFSLPAMSQLTTRIEAVETSTALITVPTSPNGRLAFKPCAKRCDAETVFKRLTPETRFVVQGQTVSFVDFRKNFYNQRRRTDGYALVSYDTEKNTVTSVAITFESERMYD